MRVARKELTAAASAGLVAGLVMSVALMTRMVWRGSGPWSMPNLIAAIWYGEEAVGFGLGTATLAGFMTHLATSVIMGIVAIPFVRSLPKRRTLLVSLAYAIASYPVVFAFVLSWANPIMVARSELVPMTLAHALFGVVFGLVYHRLASGRR